MKPSNEMPRPRGSAPSLRCLLLAALAACRPSVAGGEARVMEAKRLHESALRAELAQKGIPYPPPEIYLRAFKEEGALELWVGPRGSALTLLRTYPICGSSGVLGPKRQSGDGQVPEGFYVIDRFNPRSAFHLSLGINYPNPADRRRNASVKDLGGDIFIHGSCATIGCLPITNERIKELYVVATAARDGGQRAIPVHIFPRRLDEAGKRALFEKGDASLHGFWRSLIPAYEQFEKTLRPPPMELDSATGEYQLVGVTRPTR